MKSSSQRERVYFDNAATSWPKPPQVTDAITRYYTELGVAAGRGTSSVAGEVDRTIGDCRAAIGKLINCPAERIVFSFNGTDALHVALNGLVRDGDAVVTTAIEHNSVLRPLNHLQQAGRIKLDIIDAVGGVACLDSMARAIKAGTRVCCVSQASNVSGLLQPIEQIAEMCRANDVLLVVDAAQTAGHIPIDFADLGCDVVCASGHKGLLGPLGTGFLALSPRAADEIQPVRLGGTGTHSTSIQQPTELPYRLESGNLNVGGIFGLLAGVEHVAEKGVERIAEHEQALRQRIIEHLQQASQMTIHGDLQAPSTGVVSFNVAGQDCHTVAAMLDSAFQIQVRAGLHCASLAHQSLKSEAFGGTVRISPGTFNTIQQVEFLLESIDQLTSMLV